MTVAVDVDGATHGLSSVGTGVEAEAVAFLPGGKAVVEDALEVFRGDADTVISEA